MATITSANSTFSISMAPVFPSPQVLEGYAVSDAFSVSDIAVTETKMGIDGRFTGGYVFNPVDMTVTLLADSPSIVIFDTWFNAMQTIREVITADAVIMLPAVQKKYTLTRGFLVGYKTFPDVRKLLEDVAYRIRWGRITPEKM